MTFLTRLQQEFLNDYLVNIDDIHKDAIPNLDMISAFHFCADEYNANECARLVNIGKKTASCSLKELWVFDNEPFPKVGSINIITDWTGTPVCIIQITDIAFSTFEEVPPEFAKAEGEGDGSYSWWYNEHVKFFTHDAKNYGIEFTKTTDLVLERFKKVYPV